MKVRTSTGTVTLIDPTGTITTTGQELVVDGVRMVFQMAPGTEAQPRCTSTSRPPAAVHGRERHPQPAQPADPARGPGPRPAHLGALPDRAIELFAGQSDVVFASHHWPTWGTANIIEFLSVQRDLYAYLHDQTLRLLNQGSTGS
jgi:alkyl sulfatase BDS1-like metallo-beta-lactamase superfamily hydrolase